MRDAKSISTPISLNLLIDKDEMGKEIDIIKYRGIIRYLLYLTTSHRGIMFIVSMCARFEASSRESHFKTIKRNLRCLNGTLNYGLWFLKGSECSLVGFSDSDSATCKSDRKNTSGKCHIFGNDLISWHSKKQHSVATFYRLGRIFSP